MSSQESQEPQVASLRVERDFRHSSGKVRELFDTRYASALAFDNCTHASVNSYRKVQRQLKYTWGFIVMSSLVTNLLLYLSV